MAALLIGVSFAALFTVCLYSCFCPRAYVCVCVCICKHVCLFFFQQMSHPLLKNHHIPSHHPLCSCEGARLPALSSQSSRLLAVECWEYPERKGKWHHSGDLPCWATLPASRSQQAREPTGETAGPLGQKTVIRMCFLERGGKSCSESLWGASRIGKIPGMCTNLEAVWVCYFTYNLPVISGVCLLRGNIHFHRYFMMCEPTEQCLVLYLTLR